MSDDWKFETGQTLVKKGSSGPAEPEHDVTFPSEKTEYTVKRRLVGEEEGRQFYYLEYEKPSSEALHPDTVQKTMLYSEGVIEGHYESLQEENQ